MARQKREGQMNFPFAGTSRNPHTRRLGALVVAALSAAALATYAGVSQAQDNVVTIKWTNWDSAEQTGKAATDALVQAFEASHPNIKVEIEPISFSDFEQKLLLQIRSGQSPDVIQTYGNYTSDFNAAGALAPLEDLAGAEYIAEMPPALEKTGEYGGQLVAVPWAVQPVGLWYNKKLLEQAGLDPSAPPQTIDELLTAMAAIKEKLPDVIPLGIDSTNRVFALDVNTPWMKAFGAEPFDGEKANADTPEMKAYLTFMQTLAHKGYTEIGQKIGYFRPLAAQGKVAFIADQSILEGVIKLTDKDMTDEEFNDTWGVTTLPSGPGGGPFSVPQDHQLAVMAGSQHKQEAWEFVKWLTRSEEADIHVIKNKAAFPAATSLPDAAATLLANDPSLQVFKEKIAPTVVNPPWGPKYTKAFDPIMVGVQQVMTSDRSVDDVAAEIQQSLAAALQ
jgi:multiple sugar transport system substrate-binding protein